MTDKIGIIGCQFVGSGAGDGGGGTKIKTHTQSTPSAAWSFVHDLGGNPVIVVLDSLNSVIIPDGISHISVDQVLVTFTTPLTGTLVALGGSNTVIYKHVQSAPATTWSFTHNLESEPVIQFYDGSGVKIDTDTLTVTATTASATFTSAVSGFAIAIGGAAATRISHKHVQAVPSLTWSFPHNFGIEPNVQCFDGSGEEILPDTITVTTTNVVITFTSLISGFAIAIAGAPISIGGGGSGTFVNNSTLNATIGGAVDGVNAAFTLSNVPLPSSLLLAINGVGQDAPTHYGLAGLTVTFTTPPISGSVVTAHYAI